jgi:hypothetical protein
MTVMMVEMVKRERHDGSERSQSPAGVSNFDA